MRSQKFIDAMKAKTYKENGVTKHYSDYAIESRLCLLRNLEDIFNINLDDKVKSVDIGKQFLVDIRNKHIEDLAHTPYSNAFRHYFECMTGIYIGKIF